MAGNRLTMPELTGRHLYIAANLKTDVLLPSQSPPAAGSFFVHAYRGHRVITDTVGMLGGNG